MPSHEVSAQLPPAMVADKGWPDDQPSPDSVNIISKESRPEATSTSVAPLKRPKNFCWTSECQQAFEELKSYLSSPPLLAKPEPGEELFLYLAVSPTALAAVLVKEEMKVQRPVYYISRALRDAETRYTKLEKLTYALLIAARRLRPYFQGHTVTLLTDQPIKAVLHRADISDRKSTRLNSSHSGESRMPSSA